MRKIEQNNPDFEHIDGGNNFHTLWAQRHFQNESENVFQKLMQNKNCKKHFQTFSNQLQDAENDILLISEFIFIQINMMNFQMLINCLQE